MISFAYFYLLVFCLTSATAAFEEVQQTGITQPPVPEDVAHRELTDTGYVIRHGEQLYRYPVLIQPVVRPQKPLQRNPIQSNQIQTNEIENDEGDSGRPLFYFTTYRSPEDSRGGQNLPTSGPYIEIRRKRDVEDVPESSKVGKLRRKRTYCRKCGGGGGGGYYIPVSYAVYPVYYGGGGGGKGCNTCGGYGGGGGGGGSFSYSSSSAQSSSGSYGWGK